ncbi:MAG: hypothetical protein AB7L66_13485 [Gemmatimonadales bacterium]
MSDAAAIGRRARLALTVTLALYGFWIMRTVDGYHFLDDVDLAIHETGHLVFGWGGEVVTALGGTLFQLIVPLLFVGYFVRQRDWHAASVPLWWVGQNGWNIARYVADARAQELPLVGGGEHDWAFLLGHWNALHLDLAVARAIRVVAFGLMMGSCVWGWLALARKGGTAE